MAPVPPPPRTIPAGNHHGGMQQLVTWAGQTPESEWLYNAHVYIQAPPLLITPRSCKEATSAIYILIWVEKPHYPQPKATQGWSDAGFLSCCAAPIQWKPPTGKFLPLQSPLNPTRQVARDFPDTHTAYPSEWGNGQGTTSGNKQ